MPFGLGVEGAKEADVGGEMDAASGIAGCELEVGDAGVERIGRVDREMEDAVDTFVRAGVAEGLAALVGASGEDLEMGNSHSGRQLTPVGGRWGISTRFTGWLAKHTKTARHRTVTARTARAVEMLSPHAYAVNRRAVGVG